MRWSSEPVVSNYSIVRKQSTHKYERMYLVIVAPIPLINLPAQTTIAVLRIPPSSLGVENGLGECEPLGFIRGRIGKVVFGSGHDSKAPKALIIVAFC